MTMLGKRQNQQILPMSATDPKPYDNMMYGAVDEEQNFEIEMNVGNTTANYKRKKTDMMGDNIEPQNMDDSAQVDSAENNNSKPKKPLSAYIFFSQEFRPVLKHRFPQLTAP